jgi:hypothetical protein
MRALYEPYVHALSTFLVMPLPAWVPADAGSETWHTMA